MGITVNKIDNRKLNTAIEAQVQKHIKILQFTGENFVNDARNAGSYTDRTGNLRSSVGYAIGRDGNNLKQGSFPAIIEGKEGVSKGKEFGEQLVSDSSQGEITLVGYAAMNYAAAVEAKGRDVITWSTKRAIARIKYILKIK
jgi:hypothetical protein